MTKKSLLKTKRGDILKIAGKYGAHNLRVFGSVARGDDNPSSDIDFLVDLEPGRGLLAHAGLMLELEQLLGSRVDVATINGLRPHIREIVVKEAIPL